jgi:ABC-2 type transport system permease protein
MMMHKFMRNARVFVSFMYRDFYVQKQQLLDHFINYSLIYPGLYIFCFAYLQTQIYFHGNAQTGAIVFAGTCLIPLLLMTFHISFDLLFDLEKNHHTDYQITALDPRLLLVEQILFSSLFTFFIIAPFFPIARIFASSLIDLSHIQWPSLFCILYLGSLCFSAYHKLAATIITVKKISMFWTRVNYVLLILGGFWIPLHVFTSFSPILGFLIRLNPIVYLTEGLRQAIIGGTRFLPFIECATALTVLSIVFTLLSFHFFKKRVDHI